MSGIQSASSAQPLSNWMCLDYEIFHLGTLTFLSVHWTISKMTSNAAWWYSVCHGCRCSVFISRPYCCYVTYWFQIGKGVRQGCVLSPCLFNLYAEYIMRNAGLEETQAGIKIAGRNINNLRHADDTTLMAESEEELKSLLMKVKVESGKGGY